MDDSSNDSKNSDYWLNYIFPDKTPGGMELSQPPSDSGADAQTDQVTEGQEPTELDEPFEVDALESSDEPESASADGPISSVDAESSSDSEDEADLPSLTATDGTEADFDDQKLDPASVRGELDQLLATIDQRMESEKSEHEWIGSSERDLAAAVDLSSRHIVFTAANTQYAISMQNVVEIGTLTDITKVPNLPAWFEGVVNLRGEVLAVLNFCTLLELESEDTSRTTRMLVVRSGNEEMTGALIVDRVIGVTSINPDELKPPTAEISTRVATYLVGVQQFQGRLLAILNLEQLLLSKEVRQFELQ